MRKNPLEKHVKILYFLIAHFFLALVFVGTFLYKEFAYINKIVEIQKDIVVDARNKCKNFMENVEEGLSELPLVYVWDPVDMVWRQFDVNDVTAGSIGLFLMPSSED